MLKSAEYKTTLLRAAISLAVGAVVGALLVSAWMMAAELDQPVPSLSAALDGAVWIFAYAFAVWAIGLVVVAPIPWLILHDMNYRTWPVAVIVGAVLTFMVTVVIAVAFLVDVPHLMQGYGNARQLTVSVIVAGLFGFAGAVVGVVVWRVAYYR
jgi:hypothetical protein